MKKNEFIEKIDKMSGYYARNRGPEIIVVFKGYDYSVHKFPIVCAIRTTHQYSMQVMEDRLMTKEIFDLSVELSRTPVKER